MALKRWTYPLPSQQHCTLGRVRGRGVGNEASPVGVSVTYSSADLGGSSKYSNENFEGRHHRHPFPFLYILSLLGSSPPLARVASLPACPGPPPPPVVAVDRFLHLHSSASTAPERGQLVLRRRERERERESEGGSGEGTGGSRI